MTSFYFHNKKYGPMAESYNELTGKQLVGIAGLFEKPMPPERARLKALQILLGKPLFWFVLIPADAKTRMLQYVDWVFEKNTLTEQVLPWYRGFVGAKKEFDNLTLGEFHFTEKYYRELANTEGKDAEEALNKLIAVLYRKPKDNYDYQLDSDGDARRKFNANETDFFSTIIARWPAPAKMAVLFFYDGCRQALLELYNEVFAGDSGEGNEDGMFGIIRGLSGDKYGTIESVEAMNIHTALLELTMQLKEAREMEKTTTT